MSEGIRERYSPGVPCLQAHHYRILPRDIASKFFKAQTFFQEVQSPFMHAHASVFVSVSEYTHVQN